MPSPLSQDLATKIIEVLVQRGHVLLSKGGRPALVREIAERNNDMLATIVGRMPPPGVVENEVTSTFGDEALDDTVEEMVEDIASSLMDSEHVEDVFSEDAVIRRDVFRVVKDTLLSSDRSWADAEEADVEVNLTSLGYIAAKAAQRAAVPLVEEALHRAAKESGAKLVRYVPEARAAIFRAALASPDARLELEEAVADELQNLVDDGKVALPTIDRRISIGRPLTPAERIVNRARIDVAASRTLLRSGCTATWELINQDTIAVSLVPMSEQDAHTIEAHIEAFTREVRAIFGPPREAAPAAGIDAWQKLARSLESKPKEEKKAPSPEPAPPSKKKLSAPPEPAPPSKKKLSAPPEPAPPSKKKASEPAPPSKKKLSTPPEPAPPSKKKLSTPPEPAPPSKKKLSEPAPPSKKKLSAPPEPAPSSKRRTAAEEAPVKKTKSTDRQPAKKTAKKPAEKPASKASPSAAKKTAAPAAPKSAKKPARR